MVVNKLLAMYRRYRSRKTMAADPRYTDVYVVEFPKSGVTWLSTILSNAALLQSGRPETATFGNAHYYVPDIHLSRRIGTPIYQRPPCRLIKSHSTWNPNYNFVIYLVRNPLAVMKSYFRFLNEHDGKRHHDFHRFCMDSRLGIPAWRRHINSWLTGPVVGNRLHLVRYEDLQKNPVTEIMAISQNLGWSLDESKVTEAVDLSSIGLMKESENFYRRRNPRYTMHFVGGKCDVDAEPKTLGYIQEVCANELDLLGYSRTF